MRRVKGVRDDSLENRIGVRPIKKEGNDYGCMPERATSWTCWTREDTGFDSPVSTARCLRIPLRGVSASRSPPIEATILLIQRRWLPGLLGAFFEIGRESAREAVPQPQEGANLVYMPRTGVALGIDLAWTALARARGPRGAGPRFRRMALQLAGRGEPTSEPRKGSACRN
jgi:hypothetical protein